MKGKTVNENVNIHPGAVISPGAKLGHNVEVGAFSIIGDDVEIGDNTVVMHHAVIDRKTTLGNNCKIYPFCSIGTPPQDITYKDEPTSVEMGDNNIVREFTTINRGTVKGGGVTRIGHGNYFMMYTHIAHDCKVGNHIQFINGATLAGHVEVEDHAVIGAFCSVHQFARIGRNAYIGGYTVVLQDVLPFAKIAQTRESYYFYGTNSIGMMRNGISREFINHVKNIFHILYKQDYNTTQAVEKIREDFPDFEGARIITQFIDKTRRGITKNFTSRQP